MPTRGLRGQLARSGPEASARSGPAAWPSWAACPRFFTAFARPSSQNWPESPARAPPRPRPQRGPGPGNLPPAWAVFSPVDSRSIWAVHADPTVTSEKWEYKTVLATKEPQTLVIFSQPFLWPPFPIPTHLGSTAAAVRRRRGRSRPPG